MTKFFANLQNRILNSIADRVAKVLQDDGSFTGSIAESITEERWFEHAVHRAVEDGIADYMDNNSIKVEADDVEGLDSAVQEAVMETIRDGDADRALAEAILELIENDDEFADKIRELLTKKETPAEMPAGQ